MHSHRFFVAVIAALVAALAGTPSIAHAGGYEDNSPVIRDSRFGASPWRFIGFDDTYTTAKCVGRLDEPSCTVETVLACFIRGGEICRSSILSETMAEDFAGRRRPNDVTRYRVLKIHTLRRLDVVRSGESTTNPYRPILGDVEVVFEHLGCYVPGPKCIRGLPWTARYILRRVGADWRMVMGRSDLPG